MAELTEDVQTFIVTQLARHRTPTQVAVAVKEAFGVEVSRQAVHHYDPTRPGSQAAEKWRALFKKERKSYYRVRRASIPVAEKPFRIAELQGMYFEARAAGQRKQAAALLEQIAKEEGGQYERDRKQAPEDPVATTADTARKIRDALFQMDTATAATEDA